ncbi:hypothetical protein A1O1_00180 [Capronia coronata CBS 617.96]|uniref:Clr5 domain-containing protein n=1 Tax=Capronia coronata CBS 617.96 TaxID=1182541 RepID=W9YQ59_9EURO|nr:uncharacterized protein A1O1_00180 [Capronia coronata CBS 617.96]EXJ95062.1 hypothetical protein A1O1_00180 [Capronia coronata CBS 617.96]
MSTSCQPRTAGHAQEALQRRNNNAPKRKRAPTPEQWERMRPLIEQYLLEEEKPLTRVLEILSKYHGFDAEPHSYKLRCKQWKLGDNFTGAELEEAAKEAKRLSDLGQEPAEDFEVHGRIIPWDRVRRRFRRDQRQAWQRYDCPFLRQPLSSSNHSIRWVSLRSGLLEDDVEYILVQINSYYPKCLVTEPRSQTEELRPVRARASCVYEMSHVLSEGLVLLDGGRPEVGWPMINEACNQVKDALCKEEVDLLPTLINILCGRRLHGYRELYSNLLGFYRAMSHKILGVKHPVTAILDKWTSADQPWTASELMYRALLNIVDKKNPTNLEPGVVYSLESDYITEVGSDRGSGSGGGNASNSRRRDVSVAQALAEAKWRERRERLGATHPYTVAMLHRRFLIYRQLELTDQAEQMAREILELGDHDYQTKGRSFHYVYAMHIGREYYSDGRYAEAEACFGRAALWVATIVTKAGSYHFRIEKELEGLRKMREMGLFDPLPPSWKLDDEDSEAVGVAGDRAPEGYRLQASSEHSDGIDSRQQSQPQYEDGDDDEAMTDI